MTHMFDQPGYRMFDAGAGDSSAQRPSWAAKPTLPLILAHAASTMALNTTATLALSKGLSLDPYTLSNINRVAVMPRPAYVQHSPAVVRRIAFSPPSPAVIRPTQEEKSTPNHDEADVVSNPEPDPRLRGTPTPKFLALSGAGLAMDELKFDVADTSTAGNAQDIAQSRFVHAQPRVERQQAFPPPPPVPKVSSAGRYAARAACSFVADVAATAIAAYIPVDPGVNWFLVEPAMSGLLHATASKALLKEGFMYAFLVQAGAAMAATSITNNAAVLPYLQ